MPKAAGELRRSALVALCVTVAFVAVAPRVTAQRMTREPTRMPGEWVSSGLSRTEPCEGPAPVCALLLKFVTAFNARDFEAFRQTFADDISFFVDRPYPPKRVDGRAAAEGVFARGFAPYAPSANSPRPPLPPPLIPSHLRVQALGDVAIITFEVMWPNELARRTLVAHRDGSDWRIVHIHGSSAVTAP